jgi:hypothetical protein
MYYSEFSRSVLITKLYTRTSFMASTILKRLETIKAQSDYLAKSRPISSTSLTNAIMKRTAMRFMKF